jgi:hypothetical protein
MLSLDVLSSVLDALLSLGFLTESRVITSWILLTEVSRIMSTSSGEFRRATTCGMEVGWKLRRATLDAALLHGYVDLADNLLRSSPPIRPEASALVRAGKMGQVPVVRLLLPFFPPESRSRIGMVDPSRRRCRSFNLSCNSFDDGTKPMRTWRTVDDATRYTTMMLRFQSSFPGRLEILRGDLIVFDDDDRNESTFVWYGPGISSFAHGDSYISDFPYFPGAARISIDEFPTLNFYEYAYFYNGDMLWLDTTGYVISFGSEFVTLTHHVYVRKFAALGYPVAAVWRFIVSGGIGLGDERIHEELLWTPKKLRVAPSLHPLGLRTARFSRMIKMMWSAPAVIVCTSKV